MPGIELSIVIVNWNRRHFLSDWLKSIAENSPSVSYEIVVVDNNSNDESVKYLKSNEVKDLLKNTTFTLIDSKKNLGFSQANNLAIEQTNSPYVFLLNPDTVVKPKAIDRLLQTLKSDEKIGAVAPKLLQCRRNCAIQCLPLSAADGLIDALLSEKLYYRQRLRASSNINKT